MSELNKQTYDAIIIGAGIGGLVCACYLAKAGMKVLIIEQHDKPGGYCTTFKRKGFSFDAAAHSFGSYREGGNFRRIINELGVDGMIKITRFDPTDVILTPDFNITFWNDTKKTIDNLIDIFPKEKNNIINYYNFYNSQASNDQLESIKLKDKTFADFLSLFFTDADLINTISFPVLGNGGLPPSLMHAFTGTKIFREFLIDGGYYPQGGMQELPNALCHIIKQNNGTIMLKKLVKKILVKNNTAIGVELDDKNSFFSKYVISACDITQTLNSFLGEAIVGEKITAKLKDMSPSISTFTLYIGIDEQFEGLPREGTNIWHLPYCDLDKIFNNITHGNLENFGSNGFMFRVSPGKRTILAFTGAPFSTALFWKQNKQKMAMEFLNKLEKLIPNLKKHITYFDAATPQTHYRYTLNRNGANYGWAPTQSQLFDPDFRQKTRVQRLYSTGHWTAQTHGIPGVAYIGYNTAHLILKNEMIGGK